MTEGQGERGARFNALVPPSFSRGSCPVRETRSLAASFLNLLLLGLSRVQKFSFRHSLLDSHAASFIEALRILSYCDSENHWTIPNLRPSS